MPTLKELISKLKNNWKGYTLLALATFIFVLYLSTIPIVSFAYDSLSVVFSVLISLISPLLILSVISLIIASINRFLISDLTVKKLVWVIALFVTLALDYFSVFGTFDIFEPTDSMEYFIIFSKLLVFFYILLLMIIPKSLWLIPRILILSVITLISIATGEIPLLGLIVSTLYVTAIFCFSIVEIWCSLLIYYQFPTSDKIAQIDTEE
jgi:hypothetical protein